VIAASEAELVAGLTRAGRYQLCAVHRRVADHIDLCPAATGDADGPEPSVGSRSPTLGSEC
jgi:hypothetical protein